MYLKQKSMNQTKFELSFKLRSKQVSKHCAHAKKMFLSCLTDTVKDKSVAIFSFKEKSGFECQTKSQEKIREIRAVFAISRKK